MYKFTKFASLALAATALVFTTSCDDDDDNKNDNPGGGPTIDVQPGTDKVFENKVPAGINGSQISLNDKDQVTQIIDGTQTITFEYGSFSRATTYQVLMKVRDSQYPTDGSDIYMQLNNQGFVTHALQVYVDPDERNDTWDFEYDANGYMTSMRRSEGGDRYKITYSGGDIASIVFDDADGDHSDYTVAYVNTVQATPIVNKGNVMLFDETFDIDMDEMVPAYYAGLLGKSTANLPLVLTEKTTDDNRPVTTTTTFQWTLNTEGYPTLFTEDNNPYGAISFSWK